MPQQENKAVLVRSTTDEVQTHHCVFYAEPRGTRKNKFSVSLDRESGEKSETQSRARNR